MNGSSPSLAQVPLNYSFNASGDLEISRDDGDVGAGGPRTDPITVAMDDPRSDFAARPPILAGPIQSVGPTAAAAGLGLALKDAGALGVDASATLTLAGL